MSLRITRNLVLLIFAGWILICPWVGKAQIVDYSKFTGRLIERLNQRNDDPIQVYVTLSEQLDVKKYKESFERLNLPSSERAIIINKALREIAMRSQGLVLDRLKNIGIIQALPFWVVNSIFFEANARQLLEIHQWDEIQWIDLNTPLEIETFRAEETFSLTMGGLGNAEHGLKVIKADKLWDKGYTGYGRKAFIMDTGIDPHHPALKRNYAGHVFPEDQVWFGFLDPDGRPYDCQIHGTHVTGTILGLDRLKEDTIGVAFEAMWMGAPILLVCGGNTAIRMAGFQWAMDPDNNPDTSDDMPDVINNSWTDTRVDFCYEVYEQLLTVVEAAGIAVVFAAGNDGPGDLTISQPKNINVGLVNTFAVGALNANNLEIASFSSRGPSRCGKEGSLLIKPEVSAPGVAVRSALPGSSYGSLSGTSMAAPHVSGAVLLLKEAFPYLTGEKILLALYFSATDLGPPGEDNIYGMGLIDVEAAYHYLVDQGYQPIAPDAEVDLNIYHYEYSVESCTNSAYITLDIINSGKKTVDSWVLTLFNENEGLKTIHVDSLYESLFPGQSIQKRLKVENLISGPHHYLARIDPLLEKDDRTLNNQIRVYFWFDNLPDPKDYSINTQDSSIYCMGTTVLLEARSSEVKILWDILDPNIPSIQGDNSLLINLPGQESDTAHIRVAYQVLEPFQLLTQSQIISEGLLPSNIDYGLRFTMSRVARLEHVQFDLERRGLINIVVREFGGPSLFTRSMVYENRSSPFPLDVQLEGGKTYELIINSNRLLQGYLYDNSPKDISGLLRFRQNINGLEEGHEGNLNQFIPFKNLSFSAIQPCIRDTLTLISLKTDSAPQAGFVVKNAMEIYPVNQEIRFENLSIGAEYFHWDFGDGNASTEQEPKHQYLNPGIYAVSLKVSTDNFCSDIFIDTLKVENLSLISSVDSNYPFLKVFPNPINQEFSFELESSTIVVKAVYVMDNFGQTLQENQFKPGLQGGTLKMHNEVPPGIYILRFELDDGHQLFKKVVVQNR